jgi:hypothetical protein
MTRKGSRLADRLKAALDDAEAERTRITESKERRLQDGSKARAELLMELSEFAAAVGHLTSERVGEGIALGYQGRSVLFQPEGDGDRLCVTFEGVASTTDHTLYRESALGDKWVWSFRRRGQEERMPLFDAGLEALLAMALGLPRVMEKEPERPLSPRMVEALLGNPSAPGAAQARVRPREAAPSGALPAKPLGAPTATDDADEAPPEDRGRKRRL